MHHIWRLTVLVIHGPGPCSHPITYSSLEPNSPALTKRLGGLAWLPACARQRCRFGWTAELDATMPGSRPSTWQRRDLGTWRCSAERRDYLFLNAPLWHFSIKRLRLSGAGEWCSAKCRRGGGLARRVSGSLIKAPLCSLGSNCVVNDVSTKTLQPRFRLNSKFLHFEANVVIALSFFLYLLSFFFNASWAVGNL